MVLQTRINKTSLDTSFLLGLNKNKSCSSNVNATSSSSRNGKNEKVDVAKHKQALTLVFSPS